MKSKIVLFVFIALLAGASMFKGEILSNISIKFSNYAINSYDNFAKSVKDYINEYFRQASEIEKLRAQTKELERSATLLSTFANELNQILKDKNSTAYAPAVKLVKGLSYVHIGDYNKIWISEFEGYDPNKIYGLIYQGSSAGIVIAKDGKPLAYLQNDPKSIFAVYIGNDKIPGVAHGNQGQIMVKFIPQWLSPKEGDEVFTSGLDGIFFSGVPVGRVSKILKESSYQSVIVEPYAKLNIPNYLYVVTKEK